MEYIKIEFNTVEQDRALQNKRYEIKQDRCNKIEDQYTTKE